MTSPFHDVCYSPDLTPTCRTSSLLADGTIISTWLTYYILAILTTATYFAFRERYLWHVFFQFLPSHYAVEHFDTILLLHWMMQYNYLYLASHFVLFLNTSSLMLQTLSLSNLLHISHFDNFEYVILTVHNDLCISFCRSIGNGAPN